MMCMVFGFFQQIKSFWKETLKKRKYRMNIFNASVIFFEYNSLSFLFCSNETFHLLFGEKFNIFLLFFCLLCHRICFWYKNSVTESIFSFSYDWSFLFGFCSQWFLFFLHQTTLKLKRQKENVKCPSISWIEKRKKKE